MEEVLNEDYLGPSLGWQLFVELPNAFLRFEPRMDRAEVLETAWERSWVTGAWDDRLRWLLPGVEPDEGPLGQGFLAYGAAHPFPLLMLNGTSVEDGCRFLSSWILANPSKTARCPADPSRDGIPDLHATRDLTDYLCNGLHDVPHEPVDIEVSTAALMSARFPIVSPQGRVPFCGGGPPISVVDGGYLEGAASSTALELWYAIDERVDRNNNGKHEHCVVPYFIQIDNSFQDDAPDPIPDRPGQFSGLLDLLGTLSNTRALAARAAASAEFALPFDAISDQSRRYVQLIPRIHAGSLPPLSWSLSSRSIEDLAAQLSANASKIEKIASWYDDPPPCDSAG